MPFYKSAAARLSSRLARQVVTERMLQDDEFNFTEAFEEIAVCGDTLNTTDEACSAGIVAVAKLVAADVVGPIDQASSDSIWLLLAGVLVFFMHAGFSMLEAGSVRKQSVINIMFKNIGTIAIGGIGYWLLGYGFAYGPNTESTFIGSGFFAFEFEDDIAALFFFQFTFAATAATIVSGAVAERITLGAYFIAAAFITSFVFPVVTHWGWSGSGFMSAFAEGGDLIEGSIGLIDFAGSGIVHATGGFLALVAAIMVGPRRGRFVDGEPRALTPSSYTLMTLGTFILWFGWYGFNPGSTLLFDGTNTAKAAVTTTLSPSAAGVVGTIYTRVIRGRYELPTVLNCVLAGLVSITAGCTAVADYAALIIGAIGALVYIGSANLLERFGVDDPIGASPVHGFAGIWGVLAVGIFLDDAAVNDSYGAIPEQGGQFGMQVVGAIIIVLWALLWGVIIFLPLRLLGVLRISEEVEDQGIDASEHGGAQQVHF